MEQHFFKLKLAQNNDRDATPGGKGAFRSNVPVKSRVPTHTRPGRFTPRSGVLLTRI